jgi:hypothetical protein
MARAGACNRGVGALGGRPLCAGECSSGRAAAEGAGDDDPRAARAALRHRPAASGAGLAWRGARLSDATVARPLDEGELNGNIVFVYRAGHAGTTTVVYALTKDEGPKALKARYFRITVS